MTSTDDLLENLTAAVDSTIAVFSEEEQQITTGAPDGISLLDVKNNLLLSYLHHLSFLIVLRLRNGGEKEAPSSELSGLVVQKLIELRVYMERGVRPLETKLQYQINKVVRAAEEAERKATQARSSKKTKKQNEHNGVHVHSSDESRDESSAEHSDPEEAEAGEGEEAEIGGESHRPNLAALSLSMKKDKRTLSNKDRLSGGDAGAYKPPRITPTVMPGTSTQSQRRDNDRSSRQRKSNLLSEYVDEELSTVPAAQPSIGSNYTILDRGRGGLSAKDRASEREKREYEEANFVRLPAESKAERRKARLRGEKDRRDMFGGEDWTGLGGLGERINRSLSGGAREGMLERRKRRFTEDEPRNSGRHAGGEFERRRHIIEQRDERKRRKKG